MKSLILILLIAVSATAVSQNSITLKNEQKLIGTMKYNFDNEIIFVDTINSIKYRIPKSDISGINLSYGEGAYNDMDVYFGLLNSNGHNSQTAGSELFYKGSKKLLLSVFLGLASSGIAIAGSMQKPDDNGTTLETVNNKSKPFYYAAAGLGVLSFAFGLDGLFKFKKAGDYWTAKEYNF